MQRATATVLLLCIALIASVASAQSLGTICGGVFTAGGGTVQAPSGDQLSSAIGEPMAGAPEPTAAAPGLIKSGYLYRECSGSIVVAAPPAEGRLSLHTSLEPGHPNPFNPRTTIAFRLAAEGPTTLELFDTAGRRVRSMIDERLKEGEHLHTLDATGLSSGVYYVRLATGGETYVRSIVLVK